DNCNDSKRLRVRRSSQRQRRSDRHIDNDSHKPRLHDDISYRHHHDPQHLSSKRDRELHLPGKDLQRFNGYNAHRRPMKKSFNRNRAGFTAAEMVVSTMIMAILGIVFLNVLNSGIILYTKNTAVNTAHQEARSGINQMTRDIHASISVPQLRTPDAASLTPSDTTSVVSSIPSGS